MRGISLVPMTTTESAIPFQIPTWAKTRPTLLRSYGSLLRRLIRILPTRIQFLAGVATLIPAICVVGWMLHWPAAVVVPAAILWAMGNVVGILGFAFAILVSLLTRHSLSFPRWTMWSTLLVAASVVIAL